MSNFSVDYTDMEQLGQAIADYAGNAENVINTILHEQSFAPLTESIIGLIHPSGRTWKGKRASAKAVQPFSQKNGNLSIEIKSKKAYRYLYFPDDGSDTKNHYGDQQFMLRGVQEISDQIIDMCLAGLQKEWSE